MCWDEIAQGSGSRLGVPSQLRTSAKSECDMILVILSGCRCVSLVRKGDEGRGSVRIGVREVERVEWEGNGMVGGECKDNESCLCQKMEKAKNQEEEEEKEGKKERVSKC